MHLNKEELGKFQKNLLSKEEMIDVLTHINECDYCAAQLGELEATHKAPEYLKGQILSRAKAIDSKTAASSSETKKQIQLFFYSIKTAAAVIAAVLVILLLPINRMPEMNEEKVSQRITDRINSRSNQVTGILNDISNMVIDGGNKK